MAATSRGDETAKDIAVAVEAALRGGSGRTEARKLPVRQRLDLLLDGDTWVEDGLLANTLTPGFPADGVLTGTGLVDGRLVAVIAHDPRVKAGSWGAFTVEKQIRILERADRDLMPVIYLVDSAGGRLTEQMGFYPGRRGASRLFHLQVRLSGRVPQICCLFGPSAAGGAYMPAFTDWVGMVQGQASMYLASPRIAEMTTGEKTSLEDMGGAQLHTTESGCADEAFPDDRSLIAGARRLFGYLPSSWQERPRSLAPVGPAGEGWDDVFPDNPRAGYDVRAVIRRLVDADTFFDIKAEWAKEIVVGLGRLGGQVVGIVANQPEVRAGAIFVDSADKATRFISLCDAFNIPLVFLHDVPGFMVGKAVERQGIIRHGAKLIAAMSSAEVPKFSVILRKAFAAGFYAMCAPGFEPRATLALPGATIGAMAAPAAVNAVYARHIADIEDVAERQAFVDARLVEYEADVNLLRMANDLVVDEVVPADGLRAALMGRLRACVGWQRETPGRHHPVSPV